MSVATIQSTCHMSGCLCLVSDIRNSDFAVSLDWIQMIQYQCSVSGLTHYILMDSSTDIYWMNLFVILGMSGLFYSIFDGRSCKQTM